MSFIWIGQYIIENETIKKTVKKIRILLIKQKIITKPKKKKEKNDHENVSKEEKKIMATIEIKVCQTQVER